MSKEEALEACIYIMNEDGYISWDGILDVCDEENTLVKYCHKQLQKLIDEGKLEGELDI
jgi:uncharacterized protein involved in tolerance to divalent cations